MSEASKNPHPQGCKGRDFGRYSLRHTPHPMRNSPLKDQQTRFSGGVRHYHRAGSPARPSWDEWVDGAGRKKIGTLKLLKILGIVFAVLALGGIIVGLFVELR